MKQLVICVFLVLFLSFHVALGAGTGGQAASHSRRGTFINDFELGENTGFLHHNRKRNLLLHPKNKRFRREAENADFYKRGQTAVNSNERLKRVKKSD